MAWETPTPEAVTIRKAKIERALHFLDEKLGPITPELWENLPGFIREDAERLHETTKNDPKFRKRPVWK